MASKKPRVEPTVSPFPPELQAVLECIMPPGVPPLPSSRRSGGLCKAKTLLVWRRDHQSTALQALRKELGRAK